MDNMINVKINGIAVSVPAGSTILDAARAAGVNIPTLCFMKDKNEIGACRICVVEANEGRGSKNKGQPPPHDNRSSADEFG